MAQEHKSVLLDLCNAILRSKDKPRVYYRSKGNELKIVIVVTDTNDLLEDKIYKAEWNILEKYPNVKINIRVMPKLQYPLYRLIPEGYKRYGASC